MYDFRDFVFAVSVVINVLQMVSVQNISPHPHCVISVDLTPVRTETGTAKSVSCLR